MTRIQQAVVAEARSWRGVLFRHQGRDRVTGCDCIGLVWAVGEAVGVLDVTTERARPFLRYSRTPNPRRMREALESFFVEIPVAESEPGDVGWMAWRAGLPMHLVIFGEEYGHRTHIHALNSAGRVIEQTASPDLAAMVESAWRYPGVAWPR